MEQEKNGFPYWNVVLRVLIGVVVMGLVWVFLPKKHEKSVHRADEEQEETSVERTAFIDPQQMTPMQRMLAGRWYYIQEEDDTEGYNDDSWVQGYHFRCESLDEFRLDGTEIEKSVITFIYDVDDDDWAGSVVLQFNTIYEGVWQLKGDSLILKGKSLDFEYIKPKKFNTKELPYRRELYKDIEADVIPFMKKESLKKRIQKVVSLTDDELVVEEDGEQWSCVRIIQ